MSSKREERKNQLHLKSHKTQLVDYQSLGSNYQLRPLLGMDSIKNETGGGGLEKIEERIRSSKVSEHHAHNQGNYSNMDRRTSASTYSRGVSSQQRKFRQLTQSQLPVPPSFSNHNQSASLSKVAVSSQNEASLQAAAGKTNSELGRVKEFLPLRTQGKLRAVNTLLQQNATGTITNLDSQSNTENNTTTNIYTTNEKPRGGASNYNPSS